MQIKGPGLGLDHVVHGVRVGEICPQFVGNFRVLLDESLAVDAGKT